MMISKKIYQFAARVVLAYLRLFARISLRIYTPTIIGIAGAVGKTSTKHALYAMLKDKASTTILPGNSETGIPLGILGIPIAGYGYGNWIRVLFKAPFGIFHLRNSRIQYLIAEMGTDAPYPPKNMSFLLSIIKPHIALFLNVTPTHIAFFEQAVKDSCQNKTKAALQIMAEEDGKIITASHCKVGIYNADNTYIHAVMEQFRSSNSANEIPVLQTFGRDETNTISYAHHTISSTNTRFEYMLSIDEKKIALALVFRNTILPIEYRELFAAVLLTGLQLHIPIPEMCTAIEHNFSLPKGRSSVFCGINNSTIIDSSYNSSPAAMHAFLTLTHELKQQHQSPLIVVCGDMNELGGEAEAAHMEIARHIFTVADECYCTGPLTRQYIMPLLTSLNKKEPHLQHLEWSENAKKIGEVLRTRISQGALVL